MSLSPFIEVTSNNAGSTCVSLRGRWTIVAIMEQTAEIQAQLALLRNEGQLEWNAEALESLDSAGAILLWRAWGRRLPKQIVLLPKHQHLFERIAAADLAEPEPPRARDWLGYIVRLGQAGWFVYRHLLDFMVMIGQLAFDLLHLLRHPADIPKREISANLYKTGVRAMPVTALVGFLIGIALSYLSALQLRTFGADVFIINITGLGIIRELGPLLVAVLVAGRSGSAMTAQLGVMRVTEEIDALAVMGVSRTLRLVLPKVVALSTTMPLLVLWTSAIAIFGGMVAAQIELDISYGFFLQNLARVVPVANVWIALAKGWVFGLVIALVACHFGMRVRPNTESLSANTTSSVVTAITMVIIIDALFAIATRGLGLPQ